MKNSENIHIKIENTPENNPNPFDQNKKEEKMPKPDIKEFLEKAANFYYNQEKPDKEADYLTLLQDINKHINEGTNWRNNEHLVGKIETFLKKRFQKIIAEKKASNDTESILYYQKRLQDLLEDLHQQKNT